MGRVWCHFNLSPVLLDTVTLRAAGPPSREGVRQHQCVCFHLTHASLYLASPPLSSNHPHSLFWACFPFLSFFPHCYEVMSPWREDKKKMHMRGAGANLNGDGLALEYLLLSNYKRRSEHLHNPFKVPNISFLFILNLFVQRSPFDAPYILSSEALGETGEENRD